MEGSITAPLSPLPSAGQSRRKRTPRACRNCATSKAKCIPRAGVDNKCERCHRLEKDCSMQEPPAPRQPRVQKKTRVEMLEKKLDGLVTLLTASQSSQATPTPGGISESFSASPAPPPAPPAPPAPPVSQPPPIVEPPPEVHMPVPFNRFACVPEGIPTRPPHRERNANNEFIPDRPSSENSSFFGYTYKEADELLRMFRKDMAVHFPFVVVPDWSMEDLRRDRPCLLLTVLAAASYRDIEKQQKMAKMVMRYFSEHILLAGEKSLDLLQGMLIFGAWYQCHHNLGAPQMLNILHLAMAMVIDLGISSAPRSKTDQKLIVSVAVAMHGTSSMPLSHSLEEKRAVLGVFYVASVTSMCFKKFEAVQWSAYTEECCQAIEEAKECLTDAALVHLIKLQRMAHKMGQMLPYDNLANSWSEDMPVGMYVNALETELQTLRHNLPLESSIYQPEVLLQYHSLQIHLYEIALHMPVPQQENGSGSTTNPPYWHIKTLYSCLNAVKEYLNIFFSIPVDIYFHLAVALWGQTTHAMIVLSRLSLLEFPNWDLNHVKDILDFSGVVGMVRERWAATIEQMDEPQKQVAVTSGVFARSGRMLRRVQMWHDARMNEHGDHSDVRETMPASGSLLSMVDDTLSRCRQDETQYPVGFWDTDFLNDIFW